MSSPNKCPAAGRCNQSSGKTIADILQNSVTNILKHYDTYISTLSHLQHPHPRRKNQQTYQTSYTAETSSIFRVCMIHQVKFFPHSQAYIFGAVYYNYLYSMLCLVLSHLYV